MGIFGRRRSKAEPTVEADEPSADGAEDREAIDEAEQPDEEEQPDEAEQPDRSEAAVEAVEIDEAGRGAADDGGPDADGPGVEDEPAVPFDRGEGPFDRSEVEDVADLIDLGGLLVPAVPGLQLRLEVEQASQTVVGAHLMLGSSLAQVQVYAAPRTIGVWSEIRTEIAESVLSQGGTAEITDGPLGRQVQAKLPGDRRMRFLGVDGPRWFLRAVLSGPAATSDRTAAPLLEVIRGLVVVRGGAAMAPRELLPLTAPAQPSPEAADAPADSADSADQPDEDTPRSADDLKPFERGPEITEVR